MIDTRTDLPDHRALYLTAEKQAGYFTASQAQHAGLSRALLSYHAGIGTSCTGTLWDQLIEAVKEDNRQHANRIHRLLTAAGYQANPFQDWGAGEYAFTPEVEQMARSEYNQSCQAKRAAGWRRGPERDRRARTLSDLVPWEGLPEEERK